MRCKSTAAVALLVALVSGCGAVSSITNGGVSNPLTPEQSTTLVIDAANEIVSTLDCKPSNLCSGMPLATTRATHRSVGR
jgi:uncharacterized protein YceK